MQPSLGSSFSSRTLRGSSATHRANTSHALHSSYTEAWAASLRVIANMASYPPATCTPAKNTPFIFIVASEKMTVSYTGKLIMRKMAEIQSENY